MNPVDVTHILLATQGKAVNLNRLPNSIDSISFDTRTLQPNDMFWALRGSNFDGHDFVTLAFEKGAAACIVDATYSGRLPQNEQRLIIVEDTLTALQEFAKWYRTQHQVTAIGITGSYGKTTTREMLYSVLRTKYTGIRNSGNQNNEIGVPFNLLKLTKAHQFLIMEMGAAKPNDIEPLAEITSPQIGIITGIGPAHLEGFGDIQQIIETKSELTNALPPEGIAVIPGDKEWTDCLRKGIRCRILTFGTRHDNHYRVSQINNTNNKLEFQFGKKTYRLSVVGQHHVWSAIASIAVATELGYTPDEIQQGFDWFRPVDGRSRIVQVNPWAVIDDTYNANPVSCEASFQTLANWNTNGKRFLILGDMLELGQNTKFYHEEIGRQIAKLQLDFVFTYGTSSKHIVAEITNHKSTNTIAIAFDSQKSLIGEIQQNIHPNDVVLVKGSRGMRMEKVVAAFTRKQIAKSGSNQVTLA